MSKFPLTPIRTYADTSVYGGVFDPEFEEHSRLFFEQTAALRFRLVTSALVREELEPAPTEVRQFFDSRKPSSEVVDISPAATELSRAYIAAGVVGPRSAPDALHVALASISGCPVLVSWNFKHIVHREKALGYNAVNALRGIPPLDIRSPREVVAYEEDI